MTRTLIQKLAIRPLAGTIITALWAVTASGVPITITTGNPGNQGTDNVLLNDQTGTLVTGSFNGSGAGYVVNFTSASGSGQLEAFGGQASLEGFTGNDPFTSLTFGLADGATFTKAILNVDVVNPPGPVTGDGTLNFSVSYLDAMGSPFTQTFDVDSSGQNFFGIVAGDGARITEVTFSTTDTAFADANQFRLGGFAPARVPDGGATLLLLGAGLTACAFARRYSRK